MAINQGYAGDKEPGGDSNLTQYEKNKSIAKATIAANQNIVTIENNEVESIINGAINQAYVGALLSETYLNQNGNAINKQQYKDLHESEKNNYIKALGASATKKSVLFLGNAGTAKTAIISDFNDKTISLPVEIIAVKSEKKHNKFNEVDFSDKNFKTIRWGNITYGARYDDFNITTKFLYMNHLAFADRQGVPEVMSKENCFRYVPPEIVVDVLKAANGPGNNIVIFALDEIFATEISLNFLMSVCQENRWGSLFLPNNVYILAASNAFFTGNYTVIDPGDALMKRFSTYFVLSNHAAVLKYFALKNPPSLIVEFLNQFPDELEDLSGIISPAGENARIKFRNPYSWERVIDLLNHKNPTSYNDWRTLSNDIASEVGCRACDHLMDFIKKKLMISIKDIFNKKPEEFVAKKNISSDKSILYGVIKEASKELVNSSKIQVGSKEYTLNDLAGKVLSFVKFFNSGSAIDKFHYGDKEAKGEIPEYYFHDELVDIFVQDLLAHANKKGKHDEISKMIESADKKKDKNLYKINQIFEEKEKRRKEKDGVPF